MQIDNLRAYLANIGMSFVDFGVILDTHPGHLSRVASGRVYAGKRLAKDISQATGGIINLPTRPNRRKRTDLKKQEQQQPAK